VSIVAAGEAALASALNISGSEVQSKFNFLQDFSYYCLPGEVGSRSCNLGWDIVQALNSFPSGSSDFFVRDVRGGCIGPQHRKMYQLLADIKQLSNACSRIIRCQEKLQLPGAPTFLKRSLADGIWMIQQHIRQHGAAVTRIIFNDTFTEFFKSNPTGVYKADEKVGQKAIAAASWIICSIICLLA
jgi:hypothetical protein